MQQLFALAIGQSVKSRLFYSMVHFLVFSMMFFLVLKTTSGMMDAAAAGGGGPPDDPGNWKMNRNLTHFIYMLSFVFLIANLERKGCIRFAECLKTHTLHVRGHHCGGCSR